MRIFYILFLCLVYPGLKLSGQGDGFLTKEGKRIFPIGWYSMPKDEIGLKVLVDAGVNFINCNSKEALDRAQKFGILGWMPLKLQDGVTQEFKEKVLSVKDHPALAIWEGPDEIVWSFTATSGLYRNKIHTKKGEWWDQTPASLEYSNRKAAEIIPKIIESVKYIRSIDPLNRQIWINEAASSDTRYVQDYIDHIDITGCDDYPVRELRKENDIYPRSSVGKIGYFTDRWRMVGTGKPVWMVLQAFSWPELGGPYSEFQAAYPSFDESRYMAYTAIVHGARGIFYYGGSRTKSKEFLQSIFAVTSELSVLQPFLSSSDELKPDIKIINSFSAEDQINETVDIGYFPVNQKLSVSRNLNNQVSAIARRYGREWMIILINENDNQQSGIVLEKLTHLNGIGFNELYGDEKFVVENERVVLRMMPREVKVFVTGNIWESGMKNGRNYTGR